MRVPPCPGFRTLGVLSLVEQPHGEAVALPAGPNVTVDLEPSRFNLTRDKEELLFGKSGNALECETLAGHAGPGRA